MRIWAKGIRNLGVRSVYRSKKNFLAILNGALEALIPLDASQLASKRTKPQLNKILSFLSSPPQELKRQFRQLDRDLLESARQKLIEALRELF